MGHPQHLSTLAGECLMAQRVICSLISKFECGRASWIRNWLKLRWTHPKAVHFEATTTQGNPPSTAPIYIIRRMPNGWGWLWLEEQSVFSSPSLRFFGSVSERKGRRWTRLLYSYPFKGRDPSRIWLCTEHRTTKELLRSAGLKWHNLNIFLKSRLKFHVPVHYKWNFLHLSLFRGTLNRTGAQDRGSE